MGGGTTVVEALRLGCKVTGIDLNPVAWFIVKTEVEPVDLDALQQAHLTPDEFAFVGHDTEELDGAHRAGMATVAVHYDPGAKADCYRMAGEEAD